MTKCIISLTHSFIPGCFLFFSFLVFFLGGILHSIGFHSDCNSTIAKQLSFSEMASVTSIPNPPQKKSSKQEHPQKSHDTCPCTQLVDMDMKIFTVSSLD